MAFFHVWLSKGKKEQSERGWPGCHYLGVALSPPALSISDPSSAKNPVSKAKYRA